jgi:hypothetical protein
MDALPVGAVRAAGVRNVDENVDDRGETTSRAGGA